MLIFYILFSILFVGIVYKKRVANSYREILSFRSVAIWLLLILFVPILIAAIFFPTKGKFTPEERYEIGIRLNNQKERWKGLEGLVTNDPGNFEMQVQYIHEFMRINREEDPHNFCWTLIHKFQNNQNTYIQQRPIYLNNVIAEQYARGFCKGDEININKLQDEDTIVPFMEFIKAYYFFQRGDLHEAEHHILKELEITPSSPTTNALLYQIVRATGTKNLKELMQNPELIKSVPAYIKREFYFQQGDISNYWLNAFTATFQETNWVTLFVSLLISIAWLLFMRSMDIYNREKWLDIIAVFTLGCLASFFALFTYDVFHDNLNFDLNGEFFNDFIYAVFVVGANEEIVKFVPWFVFGILFSKLKEPFDYILYASVSALGFAFIENLYYLESFSNISIRSFISTVGHMFDASVIAFGFITARYRVQQMKWKVVCIISGFLLAFLSHGFYDFWIISNATTNLGMITIIFFFLTIHLWFVMKNSALNHSPYFSHNLRFNSLYQQDLVTLSIVVILMIEFFLIASIVGFDYTFLYFFKSAVITLVFLVLFTYEIGGITILPGRWRSARIDVFNNSIIGNIERFLFESGYQNQEQSYQRDFTGKQLRLFVPKSNPYIGDQLPISGIIEKRLTLSHDPNFYLFRYNSPVKYGDFIQTHCVIKVKEDHQDFDMDKIEIIYLIIPNMSVLNNQMPRVENLRYIGQAYSRPTT